MITLILIGLALMALAVISFLLVIKYYPHLGTNVNIPIVVTFVTGMATLTIAFLPNNHKGSFTPLILVTIITGIVFMGIGIYLLNKTIKKTT